MLILGAGASIPHGFPSGRNLLRALGEMNLAQLANWIQPYPLEVAENLQRRLRGSLDRSLDSVLDSRYARREVDAGKLFIARYLLEAEAKSDWHSAKASDLGAWYELLWTAFDTSGQEGFRETPLRIVTYNYDRSVERALLDAAAARFSMLIHEYRDLLAAVGPIHLHGQLGFLPGVFPRSDEVVQYGSVSADAQRIAAQGIRLIHELSATDSPFPQARAAIAAAQRVIFLGFGYSDDNLKRLGLEGCMRNDVELYLCTTGFSDAQRRALIEPYFRKWKKRIRCGTEDDDIVRFFRKYPEALM